MLLAIPCAVVIGCITFFAALPFTKKPRKFRSAFKVSAWTSVAVFTAVTIAVNVLWVYHAFNETS